ncbi:MAG: immune inhibitor A, partial [Candidatus Thermoplasmatota archaeon]|nr:immune inhibitor A [Candidatus Thermoplasmatota archaeon]
IKIEFRWFCDATGNYEGWYIDDVNIDISYTALQPLIFQGYKYTDFEALEEKTIAFPIDWQPPAPGLYYIQVYTSDMHMEDVDWLNNDYNCTIWFGDVCDPAVTAITAPLDVELDHTVGYVEIPINVTVCNNGTLDLENVPITVKAKHKLTNTIFFDDVESGARPEWGTPGMWVTGEGLYEDVWAITDQDFFSPVHSWYTSPRPEAIGQAKILVNLPIDPFDVEGGLKWSANIKWNLPTDAGVVPVFLASTYYWDLSVGGDARANPFQGSSGWTEFDADQFIRDNTLYWEYNTIWGGFGQLNSLAELLEAMNNRYGPPGQDVEDFTELKFGFLIETFDGPGGLDAGEGFWFDDFKLYNEYAGATVWEDTLYIDLDVGECGYLDFVWNATEYCDFVITAEVDMDCEGNDYNNDMVQTTTRIHEWLYEDSWETVSFDDNTCGGDAQWQIVEECSLCPDDSFWWNGEVTNYSADRNDILQIDETFNFSDVTQAYFNFSAYYIIEDGWDYGYVEVSNDSGDTWFILDEYTGNSSGDWIDVSYHLLPDYVELYSPYTDTYFLMDIDFFTEDMHFRFRFVSDELVHCKGWYIDDVQVNMFNGTWNEMFFDDMEDDDSIDNWLTYYICYGNHWHEEDTFGVPYPGLDDVAWWNGEPRFWESPGYVVTNGTYMWSPLPSYWSTAVDYGNIMAYTSWVTEIAFLLMGAGPYSAWANQTGIALPSGPCALQYYAWGLTGNSLTGTWWHWVEITDGVTTQKYNVSIPCYTDDDVLVVIDLSEFSGSTVDISLHANCTLPYRGWFNVGLPMNVDIMELPIGSFEIWGYDAASPVETIPYNSYYNNVDEKLVFEFDLMHAFEAILHFDHNYSFADGDVGWVEVWTGSAWQPILYNTGASDWSHVSLDISQYIDHEAMTKVRFRFISNETGVDYGWLVDNISIDGKVDYTAPTASHTISPATPNGKNGWYTSDVTITLTASDNTKVEAIKYRIDGGSWLTYTAPFTIGIEGSHTVEYYAIDQVGNTGAIGSVSFKIDKTKPTASITTPQAGYIYFFGRELMPRLIFKDKALIIGGLVAQATAADAMSGLYVVKFNEDGTTFAEDTTSPYQAPLPFSLFAAHELTVTAEDFAGNTYTTSAVPYFKIF